MYERQKKLSYIDAYEETYREILKEHQCVQKKDLAINGRDLIAQGMNCLLYTSSAEITNMERLKEEPRHCAVIISILFIRSVAKR